MRRYHEEKKLIEQRAKFRQMLESSFMSGAHRVTQLGRFRKTMRCGGCGRARCQICHSYKFPKRQLTRQEQQAQQDFRLQRDDAQL